MKNLKIILLPALLLISTSFFAQDIYDANGDKIANYNSASGALTNSANDVIGEITLNGTVKNVVENIGYIDNNQFKEASGTVIGHLDENDKVFDINNDQIGEIQSEVTVLDVNGATIGSASASLDSKILAAYFFFFFNQD